MAQLKFWKMHGIGNDYIVIDGRSGGAPHIEYEEMAKALCRRRVSVGADGLVVLCDAEARDADYKMRIFNVDGSEAEMCGNGIRCLAKYVFENRFNEKERVKIETKAGIRVVHLTIRGGGVREVSVDMGSPSFYRGDIPMEGEGFFIDERLVLERGPVKATCLSIGNPHCVVFVDDLEGTPVRELGPQIERHQLFPNRINVEFVKAINNGHIAVRTWERGCGETLACGTGACASAVVANKLGKTSQRVTVTLLGGELKISIGKTVMMSGPVSKVYEGVFFGEK